MPTMTAASMFRAIAAVGAMLVVAPVSAAETSTAAKYSGAAVTVTKAKSRCFPESMAFTGVLVAREDVLVRPDREGMEVSSVTAEIGDVVKSGQTLAQLTSPDSSSGTNSTDIRAPVGGIVLKASAVIGSMASARADPMFQIVAYGEYELAAQLSAKQLTNLKAGQMATITVLGVGEVKGRVRLIPTTVDAMTQLGEVRIFIGKDARLRSGAFARGLIVTGERCGVAIPMSAVLYSQDSAITAVVVGNERVETRQISVGLLADGDVEIREGLKEGDVVVVRAGAFVRDGDRVRPVFAGAGKK